MRHPHIKSFIIWLEAQPSFHHKYFLGGKQPKGWLSDHLKEYIDTLTGYFNLHRSVNKSNNPN